MMSSGWTGAYLQDQDPRATDVGASTETRALKWAHRGPAVAADIKKWTLAIGCAYNDCLRIDPMMFRNMLWCSSMHYKTQAGNLMHTKFMVDTSQ